MRTFLTAILLFSASLFQQGTTWGIVDWASDVVDDTVDGVSDAFNAVAASISDGVRLHSLCLCYILEALFNRV